MTSVKKFEANRRNSLKSTGPKTEAGKRAARCNAVRHGLTAETVISALEDAEDYKAFELAITADYDAQSATGLFEIQADHLSEFRKSHQISPASREIVYALFNANSDQQAVPHGVANTSEMSLVSRLASTQGPVAADVEIARCFLRLCNLPNYGAGAGAPIGELAVAATAGNDHRLSRYEATLWRQARQILFALDNLDRCKPQERMRRFCLRVNRHSSP
jgi:hypothetical protein